MPLTSESIRLSYTHTHTLCVYSSNGGALRNMAVKDRVQEAITYRERAGETIQRLYCSFPPSRNVVQLSVMNIDGH